MLLVEFTCRVGSLGLHPDAEFYSVALGVVDEILYTVGQFPFVDDPVAECRIIGIALILTAEPPVVHDKQLTAHSGDVAHHLVHILLVDVEVYALPRVQKYAAQVVAMGQTVLASPLMEVARRSRQSFVGEGEGEGRCGECLALPQMIETVVGVDSGNKAMIFRVVGDNLQFVVAAIAQCGPYHLTAVFLSLSVEREHHLSVRSMRVARAVGILYNLLTGCQRLLVDLPFVSPRAIE